MGGLDPRTISEDQTWTNSKATLACCLDQMQKPKNVEGLNHVEAWDLKKNSSLNNTNQLEILFYY